MHATTDHNRPVTDQDRLYVQTPSLWPVWPFLPLIRILPEGETEYGLMVDCCSLSQRPSYSATVFRCNYFLMPQQEEEFLALPKHVYDNAEAILQDGWRVD